ncbi:MAG: amidohydrolase family protein [Pseudomonadota bacterium]
MTEQPPTLPLVLLLLILLLGGCSSAGGPDAPGTTAAPAAELAIANVTVIDAAAGSRRNRTLLITDGRIVGELDQTASFSAQRTIDGSGRYLIPGLWDMHVHVTYEPALKDGLADLFLDYGITSVRDTGGLLPLLEPVVERWRSAAATAPNLYFSGPLLDGSRVVYDGDDRPEIGTANPDAATAQRNVATLERAGADFIKIYELVSPEVFVALADAADAAGLPIAAHVPLSLDASQAGARLDSLEHLRNLELACSEHADELLAERRQRLEDDTELSGYALRSTLHREQRSRAFTALDVDSDRCQAVLVHYQNTTQVPTLRLNTISRFSPAARPDWTRALADLPQPLADTWLRTARYYAERPNELGLKSAAWSLTLVNAMHERGIAIGAGTDTPIAQAIPGYSLHTELERLVAAGLAPLAALDAATRIPARFLGLDQEVGSISTGQRADLLLLRADPLTAIENTRQIDLVILGGRVVRSFSEGEDS